jgi:hypothetical protein
VFLRLYASWLFEFPDLQSSTNCDELMKTPHSILQSGGLCHGLISEVGLSQKLAGICWRLSTLGFERALTDTSRHLQTQGGRVARASTRGAPLLGRGGAGVPAADARHDIGRSISLLTTDSLLYQLCQVTSHS